MTLARLYGRTIGEGSHVQVTRGFERALREASVLAGIVALDDDSIENVPGALAQVGIFTGPLNRTQIMHQNARHKERWSMLAPNSDRIPSKLFGRVVEDSTAVLAPSAWAATVIRAELKRYGVERDVIVVPHGVHPEYVLAPEEERSQLRVARDRGEFRVLHLATSDRQRKGTRELLLAWNVARQALPEQATLSVVLDPDAHLAIMTWIAEESIQVPNVLLVPRLNYPAGSLVHVLHSVHLVCQPSRGEGFGLVPLEARASGAVVAATACTGHAEHMPTADEHGVLVIPTGPDAPIDDVAGATAPTVTPFQIALAIKRAYEHWESLSDAAVADAPSVQTRWSWPAQLRALTDRLQTM